MNPFPRRRAYISRMMTSDMDLVREYARHSSEEAFVELLSRHVNLVYSVALHQLRDASLAEEVTQAAFIILARKAGSLGPKTILSAWLCRTAQYAAARALRTERRRQCREQEAYIQSMLNQPEPETSPWPDIAPLLNLAMAGLCEKDHSAIVLRFFEGKDLKQVAAELGVGEDTAKTRVRRGVEKLRKFFVKRGITLSASVIAGAISTNAVQAAPVGLVKSITAVVITNGATASGSTLTLIKGALKIMAWTKAKTAIIAGVAAVLAVGITSTAIHHHRNPSIFSRIKELSGDEEAQYTSYAGSSPEQAAKTFFEACNREDWTAAATFWPAGNGHSLGDETRNYLGGLQIVRLGKPFWAWQGNAKYGSVFVPYEIRVKTGETKKFQLGVRCDNPERHWYIDGGL